MAKSSWVKIKSKTSRSPVLMTMPQITRHRKLCAQLTLFLTNLFCHSGSFTYYPKSRRWVIHFQELEKLPADIVATAHSNFRRSSSTFHRLSLPATPKWIFLIYFELHTILWILLRCCKVIEALVCILVQVPPYFYLFVVFQKIAYSYQLSESF